MEAMMNDRTPEPPIRISNVFYDFLKAFVMIVSPSAAAIYLALSTALEVPGIPWAVIVCLAVTALLGLMLMITARQYQASDLRYDGKMLVSEGEEGDLLYSLEIDDDPADLKLKSHISFKVINDPAPKAAS